MRICFPNLNRPKKAAKVLSRQLGRPLSLCQQTVSRACGYRDWHDMEASSTSCFVTDIDEQLDPSEFVARQVDLILQISEMLNVEHGDVQFALTRTKLTGTRKSSIEEQLAIRTGCYQRTSLPIAGRRKRGAIGKLKSPGCNGEPVILKSYGRGTHVITHKSPNGLVADFEYVTPRSPESLFIPKRLYLIYGVWIQSDSTKVLFSRDYKPMWTISPGQKPERAYPWDDIDFVEREWFWSDANTPWRNSKRHTEELARIADLGIVGLPILVETLPSLVLRDEINSVGAAVDLIREKYEPQRAA